MSSLLWLLAHSGWVVAGGSSNAGTRGHDIVMCCIKRLFWSSTWTMRTHILHDCKYVASVNCWQRSLVTFQVPNEHCNQADSKISIIRILQKLFVHDYTYVFNGVINSREKNPNPSWFMILLTLWKIMQLGGLWFSIKSYSNILVGMRNAKASKKKKKPQRYRKSLLKILHQVPHFSPRNSHSEEQTTLHTIKWNIITKVLEVWTCGVTLSLEENRLDPIAKTSALNLTCESKCFWG